MFPLRYSTFFSSSVPLFELLFSTEFQDFLFFLSFIFFFSQKWVERENGKDLRSCNGELVAMMKNRKRIRERMSERERKVRRM